MPLAANDLTMLSSKGLLQNQVEELEISLNHLKLNQAGCMTDTAVTHQKLSESTSPIPPIFFDSTILAYPGSDCKPPCWDEYKQQITPCTVAMFLTTEFSVNSTVHTSRFETPFLQ